MITILLKSLGAILMRLLAAAAAKEVLEWMLFRLAQVIVDSTETTHDDAFLEKIKAVYNEQEDT